MLTFQIRICCTILGPLIHHVPEGANGLPKSPIRVVRVDVLGLPESHTLGDELLEFRLMGFKALLEISLQERLFDATHDLAIGDGVLACVSTC